MSPQKPKDDTYHHGDLRNALIAAGVQMLESDGAQGLSLRKLAKQAGVSHNAPYMHFADKEALLAAIAEEGFHILTQAVRSAVDTAGSANSDDHWREQLSAGSWAYVRFALDHPSHLQVMFLAYEPQQYPSLYTTSTGALAVLSQLIQHGQAQGKIVDGDSHYLATFVWSLLHGVATILAGRKMPPTVMGSVTPEDLVRGYVAQLIRGLGA